MLSAHAGKVTNCLIFYLIDIISELNVVTVLLHFVLTAKPSVPLGKNKLELHHLCGSEGKDDSHEVASCCFLF